MTFAEINYHIKSSPHILADDNEQKKKKNDFKRNEYRVAFNITIRECRGHFR